MPDTDYTKPLPTPDADSYAFWESCRSHALRLQKCGNCGFVRYYPGPICTECSSFEYEWTEMSGTGRVYTYSEIFRPASDAFIDDVPYIYAVVELDEGPMMPTNLVEVRGDDVVVGMSVEVVYDDVTPEITLPKFRPVARS